MSRFSRALIAARTAARTVLAGALYVVAASLVASLVASPLLAQKKDADPKPPKPAKDLAAAPKKPKVSKLFKSETPLEITLTANFKQLRKEKSNTAPWHAATIAYTDSTGKSVKVPLRARTRGIWRLKHCEFPPLRLNFASKTSKESVFDDLDEPKLVSYCKASSNAESYVLHELQLYRIYAALTPYSHQTRLLKVTYVDSASGSTEFTRYAFLVEDPARMAERLGGNMIDIKGATLEDMEPKDAAIAAMFQYMIGNTDFSFSGLHNGEMLALPTGRMVPVAYDFDFAGVINPPYASPSMGTRIKSVRDRQFLGHCGNDAGYAQAVLHFQARKDSIYKLYADPVGSLLKPNVVREALEYYDDFYKDISTPTLLKRNLLADCTNSR
ncbi:MAG: hypothetical protein V4617_12265 [Gemmatimonadota bacterium]